VSEPIWERGIPEEDRLIMRRAMGANPARLGERPALVVIDVLYAFTGSRPLPIHEAIDEYSTSCGEAAWEALPAIRRLIDAFRAADRTVVWIKGGVSGSSPLGRATRGQRTGKLPDGLDPGAIHADVTPVGDEPVIGKARASAFFATMLPVYLNRVGADGVVLVGSTTSGCVRASAVDAYSSGYDTFVVADACFDRSSLSHRVSLFDLGSKYATVVESQELIEQLADRGQNVPR
jgi:maleamate amidohydrolase